MLLFIIATIDMVVQKRSPKSDMQLLDDINDTDTLLSKQPIKRILDWHEIPAWMQDNVYITGGYRRQTNSYLECAQSLFYLHNESSNVLPYLIIVVLIIS